MKKSTLQTMLTLGLLLFPGLLLADEAGSGRYEELSRHYEAIRLALLADSMEGVTDHGKALMEKAADLGQNLSAESAGVPVHDLEACASALEEIEASAKQIAESADLDSAREALFVLTRPMAKYRKLTGDRSTIVAYCSMAQKAWLQPEGELGNPYMGQKMPRCGEVVGES